MNEETLAIELGAFRDRRGTGPCPGVSLGELATLAGDRAYSAAVYKMGYEDLLGALVLYPPLLVHYDRPQGHFALLLGLALGGDFLVLADPSTGLEVLGRADFLRRWSGYVLLLDKRDPAGKRANLGPALERAREAALGPWRLLLDRSPGAPKALR